MKTQADLEQSSAGYVLMVNAVFAPNGGPGVQRSAKFAKYLPSCGWQPTVWTAGRLPELPCDESLLDDLPSCIKIFDRGQARNGLDASVTAGQSYLSGALAWRFQAMHHRYSQPDPLVDWARASVAPLVEKMKTGVFDVMYSTYSPASNHLLALSLKRQTGCPWLADFRDLWTDDYRYAEASPKWQQVHRRWEQEILQEADVVVGVTPSQTKMLASHVPSQAHKFVTITNGYDVDDFGDRSGYRPDKNQNTYELTYVGSADRWRTSESLFEGLTTFADKCQSVGKQFALRVVGHVSESVKARFDQTGARCEFIGRVNHGQAVEAMCVAQALLLCVPEGRNGDSVVPAKLYEYLASRRPILMVGPNHGDAANFVSDLHAGVCASFDRESISQALNDVFEMKDGHEGDFQFDVQSIKRFRRDVLTEQLAKQFERACDIASGNCKEPARMEALV